MRTRFFCCWMFGIRKGARRRGRRDRSRAGAAAASGKIRRAWAIPRRTRRAWTWPRGRARTAAGSPSRPRSSPSATGLSRILGLVREIVARRYFGVEGAGINAFTAAFQVPNLVRSLVADQALTAAFVPVFSELLEKGEKARAWRLASTLFWLLLLGLGGLTALFMLVAPLVMRPFGFEGEQQELAVTLSRILFPIVALLGVSGVIVGILNSLRPVLDPGADPGGVEPRDHRRPRRRRAADRQRHDRALRLRGLDPRRHRRPGAAPGAVAARPRRAAPGRDRLARPAGETGARADAPRHARPRAHQLQPGDRHGLRRAADRPEPGAGGDRRGVPHLHAPAGDLLRGGRDRPLPVALAL